MIIGEASSGGALAIGVANKVIMLENAIYSVISPEGYSTIMWKDSSKYKEAAEIMKLTSKDLYELKVIDKIIKEPKEQTEENFTIIIKSLKREIKKSLQEMKKISGKQLIENRYIKYRNMGNFIKL